MLRRHRRPRGTRPRRRTAASWESRISTIANIQGRLGADPDPGLAMDAWLRRDQPHGRKFRSFIVNAIVMPPEAGSDPGAISERTCIPQHLFRGPGRTRLARVVHVPHGRGNNLFSLMRLPESAGKYPELTWVADMSNAVQAGVMVFLTSGAFVGIAFQPPFWYFVSMGVCFRAYVWRAERAQSTDLSGWRLVAQQTRDAMAARSTGWRPPVPLPVEEPSPAQGWRARAERDPCQR